MRRLIEKSKVSYICLGLILILSFGCKRLIEVDLPIDKTTSDAVYSKTSTATLAMTGIYAAMGNVNNEGSLVGVMGISISAGLFTDEIKSTYILPNDRPYFLELLGNTDDGVNIWENCYRTLIFRLNSLIEGVNNSNQIPDRYKTILTAEAKFARSFIYFYLINLYGDVPLVLSTDYKLNSNLPRTKFSTIYSQIIDDLKYAQLNLPDDYLGSDLLSSVKDRVRPNKFAATALLARVYLYQQDWKNAELESTKVIDAKATYDLESLDKVFLKNSNETIWALQPSSTTEGTNSPDARYFVDYIFPENALFELNPLLIQAFEHGDKRKQSWTKVTGLNYHVPYKYKAGFSNLNQTVSEYSIVLRLSEQYLIRAEARAALNDLDNAAKDLSKIRERAGLQATTAVNLDQMLLAIEHERRVELFCEWAHRWLDLKRTGQANAVMSKVLPQKVAVDGKRGIWSAYKLLMPIPLDEFKHNQALVGHQNPGYSEQP